MMKTFFYNLENSKFIIFLENWKYSKYMFIFFGLTLHSQLFLTEVTLDHYLAFVSYYLFLEIIGAISIRFIETKCKRFDNLRLDLFEVMFPILALFNLFLEWFKK